MSRKKLCAIVTVFIAYCFLLFYISAYYKGFTWGPETEPSVETEESEISLMNLLSPEAYAAAYIEGDEVSDTPWGSTIELLGMEYSEQGLIMMPGTSITFPMTVPIESNLYLDAKIYDSIAKAGISDGVILVVDICQNGESIYMFDPIKVPGDGEVESAELDLSEWKEGKIQLKIRCFAGENNDATGDWCNILHLQLDK